MNCLIGLLVTLLTVAPTLAREPMVKVKKTTMKKKSEASSEGSKPSYPASTLFVLVDALQDPIKAGTGTDGSPPQAVGSVSCSISTTYPQSVPAPGADEGLCTLRSAIQTGGGLSGQKQRAVLVLRPGRFRLNARLPDVTGNIEIRGAEGKLKAPPKRKAVAAASSSKEEAAQAADAADVVDRAFRPGRHQLTPVGSTIDGGGRFQILRTDYGSSLKLQSVRLESGVATTEDADDPRAALGGAVCASGRLELNNSIVQHNRAINGGGLYTEAKAVLRNSVLMGNTADRCGGLIYAAGPATVDKCDVQDNHCGHFDCKKLDSKAKGKAGAAVPSWRKTSGGSGSFDDADDEEDEAAALEGRSSEPDASGAVTEGPPLTGPPTVGSDGADADADGATTAATAKKKKKKKKKNRKDDADAPGGREGDSKSKDEV